jgi:hypothetical protein
VSKISIRWLIHTTDLKRLSLNPPWGCHNNDTGTVKNIDASDLAGRDEVEFDKNTPKGIVGNEWEYLSRELPLAIKP